METFAHKGDLTEPVTLTTALRFYTRSGSEVKFEYTTLDEESVDVTLQVYKVATTRWRSASSMPRGTLTSSVLAYTLSKKTLNVARSGVPDRPALGAVRGHHRPLHLALDQGLRDAH